MVSFPLPTGRRPVATTLKPRRQTSVLGCLMLCARYTLLFVLVVVIVVVVIVVIIVVIVRVVLDTRVAIL